MLKKDQKNWKVLKMEHSKKKEEANNPNRSAWKFFLLDVQTWPAGASK